jgi:hypothetical protein
MSYWFPAGKVVLWTLWIGDFQLWICFIPNINSNVRRIRFRLVTVDI